MKTKVLLSLTTLLLLSWTLVAQTYPEISDGTDYWYSIYSHRSSKVIKNAGADVKSESATFVTNQDDLKWKFQLTSKGLAGALDTFKIVSKIGGEFVYVEYQEVMPGSGAYIWDEDSNEGAGGYIKLTQEDIDAGVQGTHNLLQRFITAATGGTRFVFTTFGADESGFKFQLRDVDHESYLNMTNPGDGSNYTIYSTNNDGGNPFSIIKNDLQEIEDGLDALYASSFSDAPTLSTTTNPVYYQIKNLRKDRVFTLMEDGVVKIEPSVVEAGTTRDAQLFHFEGKLRTFKIVCKTGGALVYDAVADRFKIDAEGSGDDFKIDRMTSGSYKDKLVIIHNTTNKGINGMHSYDLCAYNGTTDDGNAISFIAEDYNPFGNAPHLSTEISPIWYLIKNNRSGNVIYYNADAGLIHQAAITIETGEERDAQLFRFEGAYLTGFKIISKVGGELIYDEDSQRFKLANEEGSSFKFIEKDAAANTWSIQYDNGASGINAHNNKLDEVTIYSTGDAGSIWLFLPDDYSPYENAPKLSIEETPAWYQIKNVRNGNVLYYNYDEDTSVGLIEQHAIITEAGTEQDLQLFRFEGTYVDGFRIVAKTGGELVLFNNGADRFTLADEGEGSSFKFIEKDATANTWAIQYDNGANGINAHNTKLDEVTIYSTGDTGSIWQFIAQGGPSDNKTINSDSKIRWAVSGNSLTVWSEQMNGVSLYSISGAKILSKVVSGNSFTTVLPTKGMYVLSVAFANGTIENVKLIVK